MKIWDKVGAWLEKNMVKRINVSGGIPFESDEDVKSDTEKDRITEKSKKINVDDFRCKVWPEVKEWDQPNIKRLYDILKADDVKALKKELTLVEGQIGKRLTMDLFVELGHNGNGTDAVGWMPSYPGASRDNKKQYKTDWFSAAVVMGSKACIQYALEEKWATPSRGINAFKESEGSSSWHDKNIKNKEESSYRFGFCDPDSSLKRVCLRNNMNFDWVASAKQDPLSWSEMRWCKDQKVGTIEWFKRFIFDIQESNPSEEKYRKWVKDEEPRGYFKTGAFSIEAILNEKIVNGLIELGWINLEKLEEINNWFKFSDVNQEDNYLKPISETVFNNRKNRQEVPSEFTNVLERLRLKNLIPLEREEAVSQRQRAL